MTRVRAIYTGVRNARLVIPTGDGLPNKFGRPSSCNEHVKNCFLLATVLMADCSSVIT